MNRQQFENRNAERWREYEQMVQELEQKLPPERFYRVSRSAIVQLEWIAELRPHESAWMAVLRAPVGLEVSVSRRRARRLRELLEPG